MSKRFMGNFDIKHHFSRYENPFRLGSYPKKVFVMNTGDLFHPAITDHEILRFFMFMVKPHRYFVLTKRAERMEKFVHRVLSMVDVWDKPDIFLGVSVENQNRADERIPHLKRIKGFRKFVSVEPLLGPVDFDLEGIDWVVCGAETGPGSRPMDPEWARALKRKCMDADVPFFFKSVGWRKRVPYYLKLRQFPASKKMLDAVKNNIILQKQEAI
jgi:protein gp37